MKVQSRGSYHSYFPIGKHGCLSALFAVAFALGVWGFLLNDQTLIDAIYNSLRLIVLEAALYSGAVELNWAIHIARFALPVFAATALIGLMLSIAGQQLAYWKLALFPAKTVFINGAGRFAGLLSHNADRGRVVILGEGAAASSRPTMEGKNITRLAGEVLGAVYLRKLRVYRAEQVFVISQDDASNLLSAQKVIASVPKERRRAPRLIVGVDDSARQKMASQDPLFKRYRSQGGDVVWLNAHAQAARMLLLKMPPRVESSLRTPGALRIAIFGLCGFSRALILQLVRHCLYLSGGRLRLDIFAQNKDDYRDFLSAHPVLDNSQDDLCFGGARPDVEIRFFQYHEGSTNPAIFREALSDFEAVYQRIYVTGDDDQRCLYLASRVRQTFLAMERSPSVVACLAGNRLLDLDEAEQFQKNNFGAYGRLELFHGSAELSQAGEPYPGRSADMVGLMVHTAYSVVFREPVLSPDQADFQERFRKRVERYLPELKAEWVQRLDDDFRWSSRHSGDHIFVKLRELGFILKERTSSAPAVDDSETMAELELALEQSMPELIKLEHRRFCAERLVDGWLYAQASDKPLRLNQTLVPFEQLSMPEQNKDEVVIRVIPAILRTSMMRERYYLERSART